MILRDGAQSWKLNGYELEKRVFLIESDTKVLIYTKEITNEVEKSILGQT